VRGAAAVAAHNGRVARPSVVIVGGGFGGLAAAAPAEGRALGTKALCVTI
jgi:NADH dehydrogenase FAD-containing subunit